MKPVGGGGGRGFGCMLKKKPIVRTKHEAGASESQDKQWQKQGMSKFISGHTAEILPC